MTVPPPTDDALAHDNEAFDGYYTRAFVISELMALGESKPDAVALIDQSPAGAIMRVRRRWRD